ncbi:addiction module antitoxin, RelB/DinJ family, partial [Enterococcus faecalis ERV81]
MATTKKKPIHVNVDENLKEEAEQLFDDLGLNMTSAITIFLKQSINEQAIP